jgi:hypothetical protein
MTTTCPDAGRLRAWLDREAPSLDDHLAECAACRATLGTLERHADHAARALSARAEAVPTAAETERALARLHRRLDDSALTPSPSPLRGRGEQTISLPLSQGTERGPGGEGRPSTTRSTPTSIALLWRRWRLALGSAAAALALAFALATPEGQAVAAGFLAQFRSQRLAVVTFDPSQARQTGLFRFEQLGTVKNNQSNNRPSEVADVQEATRRAGFPVLRPDPALLPPGASKTPKVRYAPASETRLTFDREKARAHFDSINRKDLALPDKLHGATLVVALPPVVTLEYAARDNKPAVMIGQAREVEVRVEGNASLEEVRNFLLGLPNVPPELARQLRSIQDWTSTLPIPVPVDKMTWQETTIGGAPAYILNDNTGLGSGVIWQRDGRILGVAGPMKATDLRKIAESLQ